MKRSGELQALYERLLPEAIAASERAWCPHSEFPVGAELMTAGGAVIQGDRKSVV